jgi:hypothetical protein
MSYDQHEYTVNNRDGFSLTNALRLWKTKYTEFKDFKEDVIKHPSLNDFGEFVQSCWNSIKSVTVKDALSIENTEERRTYFDCIGVEKLFKQLGPKLRDRQEITKKRANWDEDNKENFRTFKDVYELYEIEGTKLYDKDRWGRSPNPVFAVRCWCTTTGREYWLYVDNKAATGNSWWSEQADNEYDAIRAIAWTIRIDITNPERIYRQGDVIIVKKSDKSEDVRSYHLEKEQYLDLMYSET